MLEALRISARDVLACQWMTIACNAKLLLDSNANACAFMRLCGYRGGRGLTVSSGLG
jgi:hypothetical protein